MWFTDMEKGKNGQKKAIEKSWEIIQDKIEE
jgi:hypothetical protein